MPELAPVTNMVLLVKSVLIGGERRVHCSAMKLKAVQFPIVGEDDGAKAKQSQNLVLNDDWYRLYGPYGASPAPRKSALHSGLTKHVKDPACYTEAIDCIICYCRGKSAAGEDCRQ